MTPILIALALTIAGAATPASTPPERIGRIDRAAPAFDSLVAPDASIEKLAEGFTWAEGPVWIREGHYLLFTDVPGNRIHRWSAADGLSTFLEPSGHPGPDFTGFREPGANGLIRGPGNTILLADHGNRAIASLDLATRQKTFLATRYQGRRFSSPNDLVRASNGTIYFTDPPYGLEGLNDSPLKEQPQNGVYRLDPDGTVTLIDADMTFPNGILLSPDEHTLYVANSDPQRAIWVAMRSTPRAAFRAAASSPTLPPRSAKPGRACPTVWRSTSPVICSRLRPAASSCSRPTAPAWA
jgi:gluconolactonase